MGERAGKELSGIDEVVPGTDKEKLVSKRIKEWWEDWDELKEIAIQTISWEEKELELVCDGKRIDSVAALFSPNFEGEVKEAQIRKIDLKYSDEIDWLHLEEIDEQLVVISLDSVLRRVRILNCSPLSNSPCPPYPQPIVYVRKSDLPLIKGSCYLRLETSLNPNASGRIIEAIRGGRDGAIYVMSHHDRLMGDETKWTEMKMGELRSQKEIHLISVPANGSLQPFPRIWGSEMLANTRDLTNVKMCVELNDNAVTMGSPGTATGKVAVYPSGECYPLFRRGVPIINTEINKTKEIIDNISINTGEARQSLTEASSWTPLEVRSVLPNLYDMMEKEEGIRIYNRLHGAFGIRGRKINVAPFYKFLALRESRREGTEIHLEGGAKLLHDGRLDMRRWNMYSREISKIWAKELVEEITNEVTRGLLTP